MQRRWTALLLAFCLWQAAFVSPIHANSWDDLALPRFAHLDTGAGLPHPVALAIAQDRDGFVWIATPGGLARWDGYRMRVFHHVDADPASLPEDIISRLLADPRGGMWLSTVTGIVAHYDPVTEHFSTYRSFAAGRARTLVDDGAGGLWVAGANALERLIWDGRRWHAAAVPAGSSPPPGITSMIRDRRGTIWVGTRSGIYRMPPAGRRFMPVAPAAGVTVSSWFEGRHVLWFGTDAGQIGFIDKAGHPRMVPALAPSGTSVSAIVEPEPGILWISLYGGGLRQVRIADNIVRPFRHDAAIPNGLIDDFVNGMIVDRSGLLWLSTLRGADSLNPGNHKIVTITPQGGLLGPDVRSMAAGPGGKVWLGFRSEGIALLDPATGHIAAMRRPGGGQQAAMAFDLVQALAASGDGGLWAGSIHGLYRIDPARHDVRPFRALGEASVLSLLAEGQGLWAGGTMGLARIDGDQAHIYRHDPRDPTSLSDNSVSSLARDGRGRLWVGTQRGLNLFDPVHGAFRRFLYDPARPDSLPNNIVTDLMADRWGRLWVATAGGIGILDPDHGRAPHFRRLKMADGLPNDSAASLLEDRHGLVWASTFDGIASIDPDSFAIRAWRQAEGASIVTHWAGSGLRLADGTLLFGGFGGMTVVRPGPAPRWTFHPPVRITALSVGDREIPPAGPVRVAPGEGALQAEFAALDLSAPERNHYAYRLEGLTAHWTEVNADHRLAAFSNLSPGHYVLAVRGTNRDGIWTDPPLRLPVIVLPAWYQTWWFRAISALAILLFVIALVRGRTAFLRVRQRMLEQRVAEQTVELAAAHRRAVAGEDAARQARDVAEAATEAKSRLLAIVSHEIRTPLNGVLALTQILDGDRLDPEQRRHLAIAERSGEVLHRLVDSILDYERLGTAEGKLRREPIALHRLAEEALALFRSEAEAKGVALALSIAENVPSDIHGDRSALYRVLLNLLGNAVKFTAAGHIALALALDADRLHISVADTGIGILPEMQQAIFGAFVQADDSITRHYGGTGLGLAICHRIAELMGGRLTVDSVPGQGSIFHLFMPLDLDGDDAGRAPVVDTGGSLAVLVVDDDAVNRMVAAGLLARLGHRATLAESGEVALAIAETTRFDVVLTDLHMPAMSGIEVAARLRGRPVRVLAMTADLTRQSHERCAAAGMDGMVAKPLQLEALQTALAEDIIWLDEALLEQQWEVLGAAEVLRLTRIFQRSSRALLAELDDAAAAGDRDRVAALAHRLRSGAGALALSRLERFAMTVEQTVRAADDLVQFGMELQAVRRGSLEALAVAIRERRKRD